jgi:hypothetical protein
MLVTPPKAQHRPKFGAASLARHILAAQGIAIPIWRAGERQAVETRIRDHDVSGTGRQTVGRRMQGITTMVQIWQRGHCLKDRPEQLPPS